MLTNDVRVNALDGDASLVSDQPTQAGGVQNGTGGQHAVCGQAGDLLSHNGENVTGAVSYTHLDVYKRQGVA